MDKIWFDIVKKCRIIAVYRCRVFAGLVMALNTLKSKVKYRISRSSNNVFMVKDFLDLSDRDQVGRALRELIKQNCLVKIGQGLYAKAIISSLTGQCIPLVPLPELAREVIANKCNAEVVNTKAEQAYESDKSTQVPSGRVIAVKGRVQRKITFAGKDIRFEIISH